MKRLLNPADAEWERAVKAQMELYECSREEAEKTLGAERRAAWAERAAGYSKET